MREKFNSFAEIEVGKVIKHCEHAIELISEHKRHAKQQNMEQILEHRNSHLHWWHRKPYTEEEILEEAESNMYLRMALNEKVYWYDEELDLANKLLILAVSTDSKVMYVSAEDWANIYKFGA